MVLLLLNNKRGNIGVVLLSTFGFLFSIYLFYLQAFVIRAFCFYCVISFFISVIIFFLILFLYKKEQKRILCQFLFLGYRFFVKPFLFTQDAEKVHNSITSMGERMGKSGLVRKAIEFAIKSDEPRLSQTLAGIEFKSPIGLAAGFDYEVKLTQILPSLGFGFETIGTITNKAYEGNPSPRLGRLPKSRSLFVNKGFKNAGAKKIAQKLTPMKFSFPLGVSIGRTNSLTLTTQKKSIEDIVQAFITFEKSKVRNSYYELNISCPNLKGNITFYPPKNLEDLLSAVDKLKLSRPVFVKMPIEKSDKEVLAMLNVIAKHSPAGVIFGNLQKDRTNKAFVKEEIVKWEGLKGNFSGKPTYERSNELISLCYKHYKKRFVIIGCGGVFSAEDAYEKIRRGASLVQLITGLVYQGPQLVSQINAGLISELEQKGFTSIREAIGTYS
jgi:dihydroorotate dehydrogenase subfamily 2